ncbi:MAG: hypothetical protein HY820_19720 [Acidobacteria bacterium]|nr:hypothetical protein [Acidobacteriota bacterium]
MRHCLILSIVALIMLATAPAALAQPQGACRPEMLRGVYCVTCTGFTPLKNITGIPTDTVLVPFLGIGRAVLERDGTGKMKGHFTIAGTSFPVEIDEKYTVNQDCTGTKTYTLKALGLQFPGTASVVYMPFGLEFNIVLLVPGDVVSCQYRKMAMTD